MLLKVIKNQEAVKLIDKIKSKYPCRSNMPEFIEFLFMGKVSEGWWNKLGIPNDILCDENALIKVLKTIDTKVFQRSIGNNAINLFMWLLLAELLKQKPEGIVNNPYKQDYCLSLANINSNQTHNLVQWVNELTHILEENNQINEQSVYAMQGMITDLIRKMKSKSMFFAGFNGFQESNSLFRQLDSLAFKTKILNDWESQFNFYAFQRTPPPFDAMIWDSWESFFLCKTVYYAHLSHEKMQKAKWYLMTQEDFKKLASELVTTCPNYDFNNRTGFSHPKTDAAVQMLLNMM